MASRRSEAAAARVAAATLRAEQLRERLARLRAGSPSTPEDVRLARISAEKQQAEALRAQESLARAYARSAALRAGWLRVGATPSAPAVRPYPGAATDGAGGASPRDEARVLRHALASIASVASSDEVAGGWSRRRRQELWEALADQCGQPGWQGWCRALCRTTLTLLPGLRGVAVSGYDGHGAPHLLAVDGEWTRRAEEIGQLVGEGPGVDAHRTQVPVLVTHLEDEQARWPGYVQAAADFGLTAVHTLPVQLDGVGLGCLTLYPDEEHGHDWHGWTEGLDLAAIAAKAVLADLDAIEDGWPLGDAGDDRVQMATGMLAVRLDVGVDEAYARLRAFAFSNARGLGEVAQAVLDGALLTG